LGTPFAAFCALRSTSLRAAQNIFLHDTRHFIMRYFLSLFALALLPGWAAAHDTWVQTNTQVVRTGDAVHVDLLLGNHGNDHRDFKIASKTSLDGLTLDVLAPDGTKYDLKPDLADLGYAPKEGFWTARFAPAKPGLYLVAQSRDSLHLTKRGVKSGKTFFVASDRLDQIGQNNPGFDKPLGHALELVPLTNPVTPMGPGEELRVQLLYQGKPLAGARVSFIPRGTQLAAEFDAEYERNTDAQGQAAFTPKEGNYYLVVAHHEAPEQKGDGYDSTKYSATLTVLVPQICPCCEE
jgi:uncharacterized GH25 family protein